MVGSEMDSIDATMLSLMYPELSISDAERPETPLDVESVE